MKLKCINLFFLLHFSSCGGCQEPEAQRVPRRPYNPNHENIITFFNISDEEAKDIKFWGNYHIDDNIRIFPIQYEIKSDHWDENGSILIAINAFLAAVKNVEMFNSYKNLNPLNKLLFFIAHNINDGCNISKYEYLFCQEFKKFLKETYPDEYEVLLKNPVSLERKLQLMVVEGIKDKNPESHGRVRGYMKMKEYSNKEPIRRFIFIPDKKDIVDSKYNWILRFIDDQGDIIQSFRDLLISERKKYLQTHQEPDLIFLKNESEKIFNKFTEKLVQKIEYKNKNEDEILIINNVLSKYLRKIYNVGDINILKDIIYTGCFYGWFCVSDELFYDYGDIPQNIKDRFQILANDGAYKKIFGNAKLSPNDYIGLYINIDKQKFSIQQALSYLYTG